jgi:Protein of unknown function (DUF5663)
MEKDFINDYIESILKKAGISNMPDDFKKEYTEKLRAEAEKRLGLVAMAELDEKGLEDFEQFITDNNDPKPEQMLDFFIARIPDFENKVKVSLEEFAEEFSKNVSEMRNSN